MNWLLVTTELKNLIQNKNNEKQSQFKRLEPIELADGRLVIQSDILDDETWSDWKTILKTSSKIVLNDTDFKKSAIDLAIADKNSTKPLEGIEK